MSRPVQITAERLAKIPHGPGVYSFTCRGVVVYVGKAADLRDRLSAYRPGGTWKTDMLCEATGLRVTRTDSELEALLLEANWIKAYRPKYNVIQRDGTSFVYIEITDEEFPQVRTTRTFGKSGTYFGPFTSAYAVRETLRALRKIFPYRCKGRPVSPSGIRAQRTTSGWVEGLRPTLHEERASGSFGGKGFAGKPGGLPALRPCLYFHLGQCAGTCAGLVTATQYRRRVIVPLTRLLEGKTTSARRALDTDHRALLDDVLAHTRVLSVTEKYAGDLVELQRVLHLPLPPHRIEGYDISNTQGIEAVGSMVVAIDGEPMPSEYKKFKIRTLEGKSNDVGMHAEMMERRLGHTSPVIARPQPKQSHAVRAGGEIASSPRAPRNDHKEEWPTPDLMVIDGGKPQLNAVLRVMERMGVTFPVVALAKRDEEVFLPGERNPLRLPKNSPALHLLQRVRDESHRFAIGYHRKRRSRRMFGTRT